MDFITHTLVGVGATRLVVRRRDRLPQLTLGAILGSLLIDSDSLIGVFGGVNAYGLWHRVASHSLLGMPLFALLSATIAWGVMAWKRPRRFGFYLSPDLDATPPRAPFAAFLGVAVLCVGLHWCGDFITAYGNLLPLWPWSRTDVSRQWVNSFDWVIFLTTLGGFTAVRYFDHRPGPAQPKIQRGVYLGWGLMIAAYLYYCSHYDTGAFW